jgi:hypothetical protein
MYKYAPTAHSTDGARKWIEHVEIKSVAPERAATMMEGFIILGAPAAVSENSTSLFIICDALIPSGH